MAAKDVKKNLLLVLFLTAGCFELPPSELCADKAKKHPEVMAEKEKEIKLLQSIKVDQIIKIEAGRWEGHEVRVLGKTMPIISCYRGVHLVHGFVIGYNDRLNEEVVAYFYRDKWIMERR